MRELALEMVNGFFITMFGMGILVCLAMSIWIVGFTYEQIKHKM